MREIKFRAWEKGLKRMFTFEELDYATGGLVSVGNEAIKKEFGKDMKLMPGGLFIPTKDENMILMQYTGLKDKNGKEIYEGDIVRHSSFCKGDCYYEAGCGQILWDDEDTGFYLTAKDTSFIDLFNLTRNLNAEVIR